MTVVKTTSVSYLDGSPDDIDLFLLASAMGFDVTQLDMAALEVGLDDEAIDEFEKDGEV